MTRKQRESKVLHVIRDPEAAELAEIYMSLGDREKDALLNCARVLAAPLPTVTDITDARRRRR